MKIEITKRVVIRLEPDEATMWCKSRRNDKFLVYGFVFLPHYFETGKARVLDENSAKYGTQHGRVEYMDLRDIPEHILSEARRALMVEEVSA